jgi:hypothetical protein
VVYLLVAVLLSSLGTAVAALAWAQSQRAESDRRWCALLVELDQAYSAPPGPSTELGRKVAAEIHRLRVEFGCPAG